MADANRVTKTCTFPICLPILMKFLPYMTARKDRIFMTYSYSGLLSPLYQESRLYLSDFCTSLQQSSILNRHTGWSICSVVKEPRRQVFSLSSSFCWFQFKLHKFTKQQQLIKFIPHRALNWVFLCVYLVLTKELLKKFYYCCCVYNPSTTVIDAYHLLVSLRYFISLSWVLWWYNTEGFWENPRPHILHRKGFSPVWILTCLARFALSGNILPQKSHDFSFFLPVDCIWIEPIVLFPLRLSWCAVSLLSLTPSVVCSDWCCRNCTPLNSVDNNNCAIQNNHKLA